MPKLISVGRLTEAKKWAMDRMSRKRTFSEVRQLGIRKRKPGSFSRERKRFRVCREEGRPGREPIQRLRSRHTKRPFTETAEDIASPQVMPSKRRRITTDEEAPCTFAVHPAHVVTVKGSKWNFSYSKMLPVTEEVTETEKVPLNKTWIIGSNYIRHNQGITEDMEAPCTSAVDPAPVVGIQGKRWRNSYSKAFPVTEKEVRETGKVFLKKIWIIGSSYIHRGEKAASDCSGENFGLKAKVQWFGKGGLRWTGVLPRFYSELSTQSPPDILVVHAGGNDLGLTPAKQLAAAMSRDLIQLRKKFPKMNILFSCINERQAWRYGKARIIDGDRRTVNELMTKAVHQFGGEVIQHPLLRFFNKKLYLPDGVHFTPEGNHVFLSAMHRVLRKMLLRRRLNY